MVNNTIKPFLSSAFTDCIFRRTDPSAPLPPPDHGELRVRVLAPVVLPSEEIALAGSSPALGSWDTVKALPMNDSSFPYWEINLPAKAVIGAEYKFIVRDKTTGNVTAWEEGYNREMRHATRSEELCFRGRERWWHGSGVAIPVFSLRSDKDFGAGDFLDLELMADWAADSGMNFIQILPVNDTTMTRTNSDSYPYNANSSFALHPLYLRVDEVGTPKNPDDREKFDKLRRHLNSLPAIDYAAVTNAKEEYMRLIYTEQGNQTLNSREFSRFLVRNYIWLLPYAAFCVMRDRNNTADFRQWGGASHYSSDLVADLMHDSAEEMNFIFFMQYHLDRQLRRARDYAHSRGVALKGDIPIGISSDSADAWQYPDLFNLNCQAGAPPDDFSIMGQNWGFPTYNWQRMAHDGYSWWRRRLQKMAEYFDAYRIDHILGFFRIWQIPKESVHGLLGHFSPAMPLSPEDMSRLYGFSFDPAFLLPGMPTDGFSSQRAALEAGRNDLLEAFDDVLFVQDSSHPECFHPRIAGHKTTHYAALPENHRRAFDRLYEDFFYHRHNEFWRQQAMDKLPALVNATPMLACAEDLGMIPACVPQVLDQLQILSLEVQRMPKEYGVEFGHTDKYPYSSVATTSTHDMSGIRRWWAESPERSGRYARHILGLSDNNIPPEATPEICRTIVNRHLTSSSMLSILPLQDYLSADGSIRRKNPEEEQINNPSDPHHYWCYRLHVNLETLPLYIR